MKYKILTCLLFTASLLHAQDAVVAPVKSTSDISLFMDVTNLILGGLFLIMVITIVVLATVLRKIIKKDLPEPEPKQVAVHAKHSESLWTRFDRKFLTKAVPIDKEKDIMLEHGYDGIHELDNDLPPWWKYGFYLTVIWGFLYLVYYHVTDSGPLMIAEYNNEVTAADAEMKERMARNADMVTPENVEMLTTAEAISAGQSIFSQNCVACHGQKGEGGVGPNLTDDYWLHGGGIKHVFKTVQSGVPAKGMIAWKSTLSPKQIQQVSSYILSLKGSNPANGKEPQGEIWKDQNVAAGTDSATATPAPVDSAKIASN